MFLLSTLAAAQPPSRIAHFIEDDDRCRWESVAVGDASAPIPLAELPGPCTIREVAVAPDGKRALLDRTTRAPDGGVLLYEVDLTRGMVTPLAALPVNDLSGLGYGADGAPRVFSVVPGTPLGGTALRPEFLLFAGRTFAAGETDGEVAIAAEYALRGGAWVLVDSTLTETGFCGARGVRALPSYPPATQQSDPVWVPATAAEVAALPAGSGFPADRFSDGEWLVQRHAGGALAQWFDQMEGLVPSDVLLVEISGVWRPLITALSSAVTVTTRGPYALVLAYDVKTPPRVYDLRDGHVVWTESAGYATAWTPR